MKTKAVLFVVCILAVPIGLTLNGLASPDQTSLDSDTPTYYMYDGAPIWMELDPGRVAVKLSTGTDKSLQSRALTNAGLSLDKFESTGVGNWNLAPIEQTPNSPAEMNDRLNQALEASNVEFASPVFVQPNGGWMIVTPDIVVRFREEHRTGAKASLASLDPTAEIKTENFANMAGTYVWHSQSRNGFEVLAMANRLARDPRIEWAEPDMQATVTKDLTPNDPGWSVLWGLNNTGQSGGVADADMDVDLAWDVTTGDENVLILVLDDGTELGHPDLNIAAGGDFTGGGSGGGPGNSCDNHGTAVAGCITAIINNSLGTIGVAPGCKVLAAKYTNSNVPCDGSGSFQFTWLASAIAWGENVGARVSNNSNGLPYSSTITSKYNSSYANGMVHFASSGNGGNEGVGYPSSLASVNSIGAMNRWGTRASFSQYGAGLSMMAPGQTIYTTDRTGPAGYSSGNYTYVNGTSFSSPYAAGVAALLLSVDPWLTAVEVEDQLKTSAVDLGTPGFDIIYGWGFMNAFSAVSHASLSLDADVNFGPAPLTVNFSGSTARPVITWGWDFGDGSTSTEQSPTHEYILPGLHEVEGSIETELNTFNQTIPGGISVYADTLRVGNSMFIGNKGQVDVDVRNYLPLNRLAIPIVYAGDYDIFFDSISVVGTRAAGMTANLESRVNAWHSISILISTTTGPYLPAGNGTVARLYFTLQESGVSGPVPIEVTSYLAYSLEFGSYAGTYVPVHENGSLTVGCCQGIVGDANADGRYLPTISDISTIIDHLFISGAALECYAEADVNQSGGSNPIPPDITIGDISMLVDNLFISGAPLPNCQ